jgi:CheY-like chemotaxis protein
VPARKLEYRTKRKAERGPVHKTRPTLLIFHVNDSTDDQVLFQAACAKADVPIQWQVADSSERAISVLKSVLALSKTQDVLWPDLVVLDIHMPGEKGFKVLEFIRSTPQLKAIPVVILTGLTSAEMMSQAYGLGANSFHEKPSGFQAMVELAACLYKMWSSALRPRFGG